MHGVLACPGPRTGGGYGEMVQRRRKEKEGWRWFRNFRVATLGALLSF